MNRIINKLNRIQTLHKQLIYLRKNARSYMFLNKKACLQSKEHAKYPLLFSDFLTRAVCIFF